MHPVPEAGPCIAEFPHPLQQCANGFVQQCNAQCTGMQSADSVQCIAQRSLMQSVQCRVLHISALYTVHCALYTVQGSQCIIRLPHLASETPAGGRALVCELLIIVKLYP